MKKFHVLEPHVDGSKTYNVGDEREADEHEVQHLVLLKVLSTEKPKRKAVSTEPKPKPDYERDSLKDLDLKKGTKDQLLVIAAYEQAEVPQGDQATNAELIDAIEKKRKA